MNQFLVPGGGIHLTEAGMNPPQPHIDITKS